MNEIKIKDIDLELGSREEQKAKMKEMADIAQRINGYVCTKCHGTGTDGWNAEMGQYFPCQCVYKAAEQAVAEKRFDKENEEKTKRIITN